jgi:hypothetical protein
MHGFGKERYEEIGVSDLPSIAVCDFGLQRTHAFGPAGFGQ